MWVKTGTNKNLVKCFFIRLKGKNNSDEVITTDCVSIDAKYG